MPTKMTPERALIVLNQCNTDGRIKVDREELKEAVKAACEAIKRRIPMKPTIKRESFKGNQFQVGYFCPKCHKPVLIRHLYCYECGQAIDWSWHE